MVLFHLIKYGYGSINFFNDKNKSCANLLDFKGRKSFELQGKSLNFVEKKVLIKKLAN